MKGEKVPFSNEFIKKDDVWLALVSSSSHDLVTAQMIVSIFKAFGLLLDRVLSDLLPVMQAEEDNEQEVRTNTKSVPTTNNISEHDFAKFDRLLREKPHASTLALEAYILFTNNKTSEWLTHKSAADRSKMMEEARKNAPIYRKLHHQRLSEIEKATIKHQQETEKKHQEAQRKEIEAKEKITSKIINYGLWQSIIQVNSCLDGMKSETQKRAAIKIQLRFPKTILQQKPLTDSVYKFSSKEKGQFDSKVLRDNLLKLIQDADHSDTDTGSTLIHNRKDRQT